MPSLTGKILSTPSDNKPQQPVSKDKLKGAIRRESEKFEKYYVWLERHMPHRFFEQLDPQNLILVTHNLMSLNLQDFFSEINLKQSAIVLCLDSPEADLKILENYSLYGIREYRTFVSNESPPFPGITRNLRIATLYFTEVGEPLEEKLSTERKEELLALVKARNPKVTDEEFEKIITGMTTRFLSSMTTERLTLALDMFFRAGTRDHCQYEIIYNEDWKRSGVPSMQIVLAWLNTPKYKFLFDLAQMIHRHNLDLQRMAATYIDPHSSESILVMSIGLHGAKGGAAWDEANIPDFLQELVTLKYFDSEDIVEKTFVTTELLRGNMGNLARAMIRFDHQVLVHADPYLYSFNNIEEGFCRHPELIVKICEIFEMKFNPEGHDIEKYHHLRNQFLTLVENLDTGHAMNDTRRKNILKTTLYFIDYTLKTNFYRNNKTSLSFRLDPQYLDLVPYNRKEKFPELPYGIFFVFNSNFTAFHIRFKDLSRGGLRTVTPERKEQLIAERSNLFQECYNLAYTQQKKNKDIPEGGSKGVILLEPSKTLPYEIEIFRKEMELAEISEEEMEDKLMNFERLQKREYLLEAQRSFTNSFLTILNCEDNGCLRAKHIVDYWKRPEYIYLGPDEKLWNRAIEWISEHCEKHQYKPGRCFITSKPGAGINHKEYGVTSFGLNVYMHQLLLYLGIDPEKDPFTIKISGGPDGDVAGNQILNLHKFYPQTAKLLALTDVSGTIYDPEGLDLEELAGMFHNTLPIRFYPPEKLHEDGFLLDRRTKREHTAYAQQTLCWRKKDNKLAQDWLSGNEMNQLFRNNVHQTKTDIFVPCGGRPRTLNLGNYQDFLDETGKPTSKAIAEGANLYLTQEARRQLEKLGVLIIKDSSCNKGGVICSSFEVLSGLVLSQKEFLKEKKEFVPEILNILKQAALNEAQLLLHTHQKTSAYLTDISDEISVKINTYKYQLLDYLETIELSEDPNAPLIRALAMYCPPILREKYFDRILKMVPDIHKKAVIAVHIASHLVYQRGLEWSPSIVEVLPLIAQDPSYHRISTT